MTTNIPRHRALIVVVGLPPSISGSMTRFAATLAELSEHVQVCNAQLLVFDTSKPGDPHWNFGFTVQSPAETHQQWELLAESCGAIDLRCDVALEYRTTYGGSSLHYEQIDANGSPDTTTPDVLGTNRDERNLPPTPLRLITDTRTGGVEPHQAIIEVLAYDYGVIALDGHPEHFGYDYQGWPGRSKMTSRHYASITFGAWRNDRMIPGEWVFLEEQ